MSSALLKIVDLSFQVLSGFFGFLQVRAACPNGEEAPAEERRSVAVSTGCVARRPPVAGVDTEQVYCIALWIGQVGCVAAATG